MKGKMVLLVAMMVLSLGLVGTPASYANSLTFQNVTFGINAVDSNNFTVSINNALNATGDWTGITSLANFSLKDIGTISGVTLTGWSVTSLELNANGCAGGDSGGFCFSKSPALPLTNNLTFNINYTSGTLDLTAPHLKVRFFDANGEKQGSLLSQTVPAPEPSSLMLLGAAFAAVGIWRRRALQL